MTEEIAREFSTIGVIGLGTMGAGIAEVFARHGHAVIGVELNEAGIERGRQHLEHSTGRAVKREKMTQEQADELLGRITLTTSMADLADADLVVEAVVESLEVKKSIFRTLDGIVRPDAVLATNTSSLRVDDLAAALARPRLFGGLHFFNPVEKMPLVEIVRGEPTSDDTLATLHGLAVALGKTPVVVRDGPGFWVNRLLTPYLNEAAFLYAEGVPVETLDGSLERFGLPMGPLALLDEVGLDVAAKVGRVMARAFPDRMRPHALLHRLEATGRLGTKSGRGF